MASEYRFHAGARKTMRLVIILCGITIILLPLGLWLRHRVATAKLVVDDDGVTARGRYATARVRFADVARFGITRMRHRAGALAQAADRALAGGADSLTVLCFQDRRGKTRSFAISMFERQDDLVREIGRILGKHPENVAYWNKWPTPAA